jgi:hypothetical protein
VRIRAPLCFELFMINSSSDNSTAATKSGGGENALPGWLVSTSRCKTDQIKATNVFRVDLNRQNTR